MRKMAEQDNTSDSTERGGSVAPTAGLTGVSMDASHVEQMLRRHAAMYDWSKGEASAINDFILTVREGVAEELAARAAITLTFHTGTPAITSADFVQCNDCLGYHLKGACPPLFCPECGKMNAANGACYRCHPIAPATPSHPEQPQT